MASLYCNIDCVNIQNFYEKFILERHFIKFLEDNRCMSCFVHITQRIDLSYKNMKKHNFCLWFKAIEMGRYDVLCALLEHGCERYSEYIDEKGNDSYKALMLTIGDNIVSKNTFTDIFWLFVAAGIPVDESVIECVDRIATGETEDIIAEYCYLNYYFFHKK